MLPVKPSVTITSAAPLDDVAALDVADELEGLACPRRALAQLGVGLEHERAAAPGLLAVGQQPDARALARRAPSRASAAPMNANCTRCSRRASAFAPTSSSVTGLLGDRQRDRERRAVDAARALDVERARPPAPRRSPPAHTSACARPSATALRGLHDRGLGRRARRRAPGPAPWRSRPARRRSRRPRGGSPSSAGGPEQEHARALRGRERRAGRDLGRPEIGAVAVDRDHRPRVAPRRGRGGEDEAPGVTAR